MTRKSSSYRCRYRRRNRRHRPRGKSVVGSMLWEVIAIIVLMILTTSKIGGESSPSTDLTAQRTMESGSMITGFLSDQWDRNQMNFRR